VRRIGWDLAGNIQDLIRPNVRSKLVRVRVLD
jgi:hypothetical protein